ncbi:NYNRIN [Sigmodon hispidus]
MLLSGGRPPAQEWFMVQSKSKPRVHRQRLQVQRIFRVKVNAFQSRPDTPYFWLQLEGPRENTGKAKEYLKGLCSPELWKEVRYPPVLHCAFLGARGLFLDCLCWNTLAYLVPGPPGSLMVGGLTESFTMTQNWLEELVARLRWGPAPMVTPRGGWETEVTRAFGALVWLRGDQYAGDLLQLPPAVQELLLSLVQDAAGKEDIIEWLGHFGISKTGTLNQTSENSKTLTSLEAAGSLIPVQSTQQETSCQLVPICPNKQVTSRPMGPIQLKLPGQNPLPLNLEWKQKALTPPPSAENQACGDSTKQREPTAQERPVAQAGMTVQSEELPTAPQVPPALKKSAVHAEPTAPQVPPALNKSAVHAEPTASQVPPTPPNSENDFRSTAPKTSLTTKAPGASKASGASKTSAAQKASTAAGPNLDVDKLLSEVQASKSRAVVPKSQRKAGKQGVQANNTVTCFQRYHEALNTPFELDLSGEPGNPGLRRVVIDGSSVAMVHGLQHFFSCRGIAMAVQFFWNRGHREVTVFVPTWQLKKSRRVRESHFLTQLHKLRMLSITPSQLENGKKITTYDYRFMVKLAEETDGIIVTNEQIHILMNNSKKLMVKDRLLPFTFAGNLFMVPDDPLGRDGPTLDEFLKKPNRLDMDIGNFLKVWKALPPSSANISELSDEADPEPLVGPQNVEEVGEKKDQSPEEELMEEPATSQPDEQDNHDSSPVPVFGAECPFFSEEILWCLSLHDPSEGALDIDLLPVVSSPYPDVPWDGKAPCQQVLAQLAQLTIPSNFTALSFFMGFMDSHRDVIPDYEVLVGPLHSLLKQKPDWRWNQEHEKAFLALKRALVSALCLSTPNSHLPFFLEVTVSQVSLTAILQQEHSGRRHLIAYTSKPLLPDVDSEGPQSGGDSPYAVAWALKHFSRCIGDHPVVLRLSYASRPTVDDETPPVSLAFSCSPYTLTYTHLAAVACGLERFGQSRLPVVFVTHCNWIFTVLWEFLPLWKARGFLSSDGASLPQPSLLSYIISLTSGFSSLPFIYRTSYRGSLFAVTVDNLAKQGAQGGGQWWDLPKDVPVPMVTPHAKVRKPNLLALQMRDSTLADIITKLQAGQKLSGPSPFSSAFNSLSLDKDSGLLMFKGEKHPRVWVVPRQLRRDLIFSVHDTPLAGHPKPEETYKKLRLLGWWPGMQEHVKDYCRSCLYCIPRNLIGSEWKVIESPWPARSTAPWSSLQIEVVGPVNASEEGHKHVLIVADAHTRWVEAFPLKPYTHMAVAQVLLQHVFARWGVPIRLEAAQGSQFARHVLVCCGLALGAQVSTVSRALQFSCLMSSEVYWEFKRALKEFIFLQGKRWAASLPLLHLAFRASTPEATPYQVLTGGEVRLVEPVWWEMSSANIEGLKMDAFLLRLMRELLDLHWRVAEKANEKAENRGFKRETQEKEWNVGDQVLLLSLPRNGSGAKWVGPFYIVDRFSLSLYRVWGFPTPEKLGCVYPGSLMKAFTNSDTPLSLDVPLNDLEQ